MKTSKFILFLLFILILSISGCLGEVGIYASDASDDTIEPDTGNDAGNDSQPDTPDAEDDADGQIEQTICGNGIIEDGELCDDGNILSGDGCNSSCSLIDSLDFVGNTRTFGDQDTPVLITSPTTDSTVLLIYTDWSNDDGDGSGIKAHYFQHDGKQENEFNVNSGASGNQHSPAAAIDSDGNIFIIWVNDGEGPSYKKGIRGIILDLNGNILIPEFQIDEMEDGEDIHPSIAVSDNGFFFIVWADTSAADGADLKGRFFNNQGVPQENGISTSSGEFLIPIALVGFQIRPVVNYFDADKWTITYEDYDPTGDTTPPGISTVILGINGVFDSSFSMNSIKTEFQAEPHGLFLQSQFVSCWIDNSHQFDPWVWGVHCRIFGLDFTPVSEEFQVSENTIASQLAPFIVATDSGFMVIWEDWGALDGNGAAIRGRRFDLSGTPLTGEFSLNSTTYGHQTAPISIQKGDFHWIAWEDGSQSLPDESGKAIRIRIIKSSFLTE
jgi:cysteine-rich repeat protein